jgi:membrane protease YdiL (CAAX protease family)
MVLVINGYGEEVGWRGFAWTRLRERHSMAGAAARLGLVWAGWHLPVFWLDTGMRNLQWFVIPGWIIGLMAGAVVLVWLYERACSSLLIVAMFHTLLNVASATLATEGLPVGGHDYDGDHLGDRHPEARAVPSRAEPFPRKDSV